MTNDVEFLGLNHCVNLIEVGAYTFFNIAFKEVAQAFIVRLDIFSIDEPQSLRVVANEMNRAYEVIESEFVFRFLEIGDYARNKLHLHRAEYCYHIFIIGFQFVKAVNIIINLIILY